MESNHDQRLSAAVSSIRGTLIALVAQVDELCNLVERQPVRTPLLAFPGGADARVQIDPSTFSVHWAGKRCALGNTTAFRVMERLARRPNVYLSIDQILEELWSGPRAYSTVRSTVFRLKARLRRAGLDDLADLIDGGTPGHYALMINKR